MATYMISDITVRDRTAFEIYRTRAADAIHTYGGRYLARLGEVQVLEGSWNKALVLQAFDTLFNKRDYAAAERF